jgi:hypothetical protein
LSLKPYFRAKALSLAVFLILLVFLAGFIRPVKIARDNGSSILWLWAWDKGRVEFRNSITGRPVIISFKMPWRFSGFLERTDPGTEEYYTAGVYDLNEQLLKERTSTIAYCSEVGITLTLGRNVYPEQGGCIRATLLWPF